MRENEKIPGKYWLLLFLVPNAVSFSFQGSRGLYETTEGCYAECSREMIETGNYLEPQLNYKLLWTKPPLTYWAIAEGMRLLGPSERGVRAYNTVAFLLSVLAVTSIGMTLWGPRAGFPAGLIYTTSPFPVFGAYAVTTDTLLTLWETGAVLCFLKAERTPSRAKIWVVALLLFLGLGFLTKGPPALVPLLPIVFYRWRFKGPPGLLSLPGMAVFVLVGLSWYIISAIRHPELVAYFLGTEVIGRIASHSVHNSEWYKPFTLYLPPLPLGAGPWLYFGVKGIRREGFLQPRTFWSRLNAGGSLSFLIQWLFLPLLLFALVKSRLHLYVLLLFPVIALAIGRRMSGNTPGGLPALGRALMVASLTVVALIGVKGALSAYPNKNDMKRLYNLCRALTPKGDVETHAFNQAKLYGLQFYLSGHLKRVSLSGTEAWADASIKDLTREFKGQISPVSHLFVSDKTWASVLAKELAASGSRFDVHRGRFWIVYLLRR